MSTPDVRFAEVYEAYFKHVHAYCRRRTTTDRVDDAVAEPFAVAWKKIEQVPDGSNALPWLYRVSYGVISNMWRSASRRGRLTRKLNGLGVESTTSSEEVVVMREEARQILDALSTLKPSDQEVLRLSIWEGLSTEDVALTLDVSADATRQRLSRARRNLAREYDRIDSTLKLSPIARKGGAL